MRTCVVFNPSARGDKARVFRESLAELGSHCVFTPTTCAGDGRRLAAEAVHKGAEAVIAAGGDGTINEVLNGIADVPGGLERVRLGILPLGTANVFARELHLPANWRRAWQAICQGTERTIDLVRVAFAANGTTQHRYLVQLAGAGLDARATELVDWHWKKRVSYFAYIMAGLRALREPQVMITAETDDEHHTGQLVLMGNGRLYGGPFPLFPAASMDDGRFDVRIFPSANVRLALECLLGICTGRLGRLGGSTNVTTHRLRLSSLVRVPLQLDGEHVGELPAEFRLEPRRLRVLAPCRDRLTQVA